MLSNKKYNNWIMDHYKQGNCKDGSLIYDELDLDLEISEFDLFVKIASYGNSTEYIYIKEPFFGKKEADAEILLSRLYEKFGIKSATYYPVNNGDIVISDDVGSKNNILTPSAQLTLNLDRNDGENICFSDHAITNQSTMRILDLGSKITDRHKYNFLHVINCGKIDDVVVYDFGRSAIYPNEKYYNDFTFSTNLTREEMLKNVKQNEMLEEFVDKHALAEQMGVASDSGIVELAREIRQDLGYNINEEYIDNLRSSFEEVAEILDKSEWQYK